jgi:hypothetical protein
MRNPLCAACVSIVVALLAAPAAAAGPLPDQAVQVVDYRIAVKLDAATHQIDGTERLVWRNPSTDPVSELWFHLYLNAFKNNRTTFVRESGGQLRGDQLTEGKWGWIDVKSMKLADGTDLTPRIRFAHPDDDNADDQTVVHVALPKPVEPLGTVILDIVFKAQLPQVFARSGYYRDFHLVGQWFPKIGVYEPAGTRRRVEGGWNCHQYHANSEFYADFGHFLVNITVPSRFVVGATGERTAHRQNPDGTTTYTYEQADVHDFAWTADPDYVVVKRTFSATKDVTPVEYEQVAKMLGLTLDEVRLTDVEITLLIHPYRMPQVERHIDAAKAGIKYFGLWYGRYPYKTLTVVDPATGASGAGGMEYPTFITAGTSFLLNYWPFSGLRGVEMVTVHEFGHQFWYAMVGNNEFEEAWLDEGINSYSTGRVLERVYGRDRSMADLPFMHVGERDTLRLANAPDQRLDAILQRSWEYSPGMYSFFSYMKPEIALFTLENLLGEQTMARVMRTYHERWRFRHPSSDDFFAVASEVAGQDLSWFFDPIFRGTGVLDYAVDSVSTDKAPVPTGLFDSNGTRTELPAKDAAGGEKAAASAKGPDLYQSTVVVQRLGDVSLPVEIAFKFEGRPPERQRWDGRSTWKRFTFTRPERLEWAEVDPDRKLALDVDWLNNGRRVSPDGRVAAKLAATWMFWVQNLLSFAGL